MLKNTDCQVGHDSDDDGLGAIIVIIGVVIVILCIIAFGGGLVGGFYSIKNYILAFKHNVVDSNRQVSMT